MLSALLTAAAETVRKDLKLTQHEVKVLPDAQPHPNAGELFLSVYGTEWSQSEYHELNDGLAESYGLNIAITQRIAKTYVDRMQEDYYLKSVRSVEGLARQVVKAMMTQRYQILLRAGEIMPGTDKMVEPFRWRGCDAVPQRKGPDWFYAVGEQTAGLVMECRFGGAIRIQHFDVMV